MGSSESVQCEVFYKQTSSRGDRSLKNIENLTLFDPRQRAKAHRRATNRQQCGYREAGMPFARSSRRQISWAVWCGKDWNESGSGVAGQPGCRTGLWCLYANHAGGRAREGTDGREQGVSERDSISLAVLFQRSVVKRECALVLWCVWTCRNVNMDILYLCKFNMRFHVTAVVLNSQLSACLFRCLVSPIVK